jgi:glycosyltransferase involved in cell wall biosynthesis
MNNLKISVIMPVFNGEKYLAKAIGSFQEQKYPFKELIIVDGKSTDSSHRIIQQYVDKDENIKWIKYADKGAADAANKGLTSATGDIIGYLGCDDIIFDQLFSTISLYYKDINFDAIYFNSYTYLINEKRCLYRQCPDLEINRKNLLKYGTIVGLQNIYFKKEITDKYKFNPENKWSFDYEYYLQITEEKLLFLHVDTVGTINIFDNNISTDPEKKQYFEAVEAAKKYSQPKDELFFKHKNIVGRLYKKFKEIKIL